MLLPNKYYSAACAQESLEEGAVHYLENDTSLGGVVSSLLANIYLQEVLDVRFQPLAVA